MPVDKIKVFACDDASLKTLGELLSNDTSRKIIKVLMEQEMYTNEIATKLDMRVSLVIHHLKKLEDIGLLTISHKKIVRKGNQHRYFKINERFFIALDLTKEEIEETGLVERIFKSGVKICSVALVGGLAWLSSTQITSSLDATENMKVTPHIDIWIPLQVMDLLGEHFLISTSVTALVMLAFSIIIFYKRKFNPD